MDTERRGAVRRTRTAFRRTAASVCAAVLLASSGAGAVDAHPPAFQIVSSFQGAVTVEGAQGGDQLILAQYDPRTGRCRRTGGFTSDWSRTLDFGMDGSDVLLKGFVLDQERLPRCDSSSMLVLSSPGVWSGGTWDAVTVTERIAEGTHVTLRDVTIRGDLTILAEQGLAAVELDHCTIGGRIDAGDEDDPIELADPLVTLRVDREAAVDWILVDYDAFGTLLTWAFWRAIPSDMADPPSRFPAYAKIRTVLDALAMTRDPDDGQGSVFDGWAGDAYKDRIAARIRTAEADGTVIIATGHGLTATPASPLSIDCTAYPMAAGKLYALAAVGRAPGSTEDGFRAVFPLAGTAGGGTGLLSSDAPDPVPGTLSSDAPDPVPGTALSIP